MKHIFSFVLVVVLILSMSQIILACSSFAVYGKNGPIIGMNVDVPAYDEAEQSPVGFFEEYVNRIAIDHWDTKIFTYDYIFFFTDRGVFGCGQMALPSQRIETRSSNGGRLLYWSQLYSLGTGFEKATDIVEVVEGARLYHYLGYADFHYLFADSQGNAIIVEPGAYQNYLFPMEDDYLVMTNFYHHLVDSDYKEPILENYPQATFLDYYDRDRRYRMADVMIKSSIDEFDYIKGLEVLETITQTITKFSIVIAPEQQKLYIALLRDFSRIWQVDLEAETISTYRGFVEHRIEHLDATGISIFELMEWR